MNEVKLNINIPYSMFAKMVLCHFRSEIKGHVSPQLTEFIIEHWVLCDTHLKERLIQTAKKQQQDDYFYCGGEDEILSGLVKWMQENNLASVQGSKTQTLALDVINVPADKWYKDKVRGDFDATK